MIVLDHPSTDTRPLFTLPANRPFMALAALMPRLPWSALTTLLRPHAGDPRHQRRQARSSPRHPQSGGASETRGAGGLSKSAEWPLPQ